MNRVSPSFRITSTGVSVYVSKAVRYIGAKIHYWFQLKPCFGFCDAAVRHVVSDVQIDRSFLIYTVEQFRFVLPTLCDAEI
jgi:hypothetical protein